MSLCLARTTENIIPSQKIISNSSSGTKLFLQFHEFEAFASLSTVSIKFLVKSPQRNDWVTAFFH